MTWGFIPSMIRSHCCFFSRGGGHPQLQRHMSDYGPSRSWDSYGGGPGRRSSGPRGDYGGGGRRSDDYGYSALSAEEWNRQLPPNERLERSVLGAF